MYPSGWRNWFPGGDSRKLLGGLTAIRYVQIPQEQREDRRAVVLMLAFVDRIIEAGSGKSRVVTADVPHLSALQKVRLMLGVRRCFRDPVVTGEWLTYRYR